MKIFADIIVGNMTILTSGGNGIQGQDGAQGKRGADSLAKVWKAQLCPYIDCSSWTGGWEGGGGGLRQSPCYS